MPDERKSPPKDVPTFEVVDPHNIVPVFADYIVSVGNIGEVAHLTLGATDHSLVQSEEDAPRVIVIGRVRVPIAVLRNVHRALGDLISSYDAATAKADVPDLHVRH